MLSVVSHLPFIQSKLFCILSFIGQDIKQHGKRSFSKHLVIYQIADETPSTKRVKMHTFIAFCAEMKKHSLLDKHKVNSYLNSVSISRESAKHCLSMIEFVTIVTCLLS